MTKLIEVQMPCPVLNTPNFRYTFGGVDGDSLALDEKGHMRSLEFIALPGMLFHVLEKTVPGFPRICRVRSDRYPQDPLYIDSYFTKKVSSGIYSSNKLQLDKEAILQKMLDLVGTRYVWGGNWSAGIPELLTLYPPKNLLNETKKSFWQLQGVDCSGLLYEATNGHTPRNTSELIQLGEYVSIRGKSSREIQSMVQPLDMILYKGHVIFVVDNYTTIESKENIGVMKSDLQAVLLKLMEEKVPCDDYAEESAFYLKRIASPKRHSLNEILKKTKV